jgi:hypothetical protein
MKLRVDSSIKISIVLSIAGFLSIVFFNLFVDPEGRFSLLEIQGINSEKPLRDKKISKYGLRLSKMMDIESGNYNTIILGSSRAIVGLDPLHPAFDSSSVYNTGLPGISMDEIYTIFQFSHQKLDLDKVIIGLDFESFSSNFSDRKKVEEDFQKKLPNPTNNPLDLFKSLFSIEATKKSFNTIKFNLQKKRSNYTSRGLYLGMRKQSKNCYRELFVWLPRRFLNLDYIYPGFSYSKNARLDYLSKIIEQSRKNKIKVYLFISPIHARQLEAIRVSGLWSTYEQWERDLVEIVAENSKIHPNEEPITLWDFSGYNSITTEKIPPSNSKEEMKWYYDSSHFSKEAGDVVLDLVLNGHNATQGTFKDFGVPINVNNIESHLKRIRTEQVQYQKNYPQEFNEIERLGKEAESFKKKNMTFSTDQMLCKALSDTEKTGVLRQCSCN